MPNTAATNRPLFTPRPRYTAFVLAAMGLLIGLGWTLWTANLWFRLHLHLPWRDTRVILHQLVLALEAGDGWLTDLFGAHYSAHRIAVPRLLVAADLMIGNGQNHLFYSAGWLSVVAILWMYFIVSRQAFRHAVPEQVLLAGLALCFLFGPSQLWNFINPINLSWHITLALSMAAFYCLLRRGAAVRRRDWLMAYGLSSLAAFTTFGGVICWLLLPLAGSRASGRAIMYSLAVSIAFAALYSWNLKADATLVLDWEQGPAEALQRMHEAAAAALEATTPVSVVRRGATMLAWPLSERYPTPASILVLTSSLLFLPTLIVSVHWRPRGKTGPDNLSMLCLLLAALCIGIALAIQLGRMMQPAESHIHGPSFERYQTVVGLYWMAFFGLLLDYARRWPAIGGNAAMLSSIALTWLLMVPGGTYLSQEVASISSAMRIYADGERGNLKLTGAFRPEYLFRFDEFFRSRKIAYRSALRHPPAREAVADCAEVLAWLKSLPGEQPGEIELTLALPPRHFLLTRELWLTAGGERIGRLYPVHTGDSSALALVSAGRNQWRGTMDMDKGEAMRANLVAVVPLGARTICSVSFASVHRDQYSGPARNLRQSSSG